MTVRTVVVVAKDGLFREGLSRLLSGSERIKLVGLVETLDQVKDLLLRVQPDVILVNRDDLEGDDQPRWSELIELAVIRVITVNLANRDIVVYSRQKVTNASMDDLFAVLDNSQTPPGGDRS